MSGRLMVATETFTTTVAGSPFQVNAGVFFAREDDEIVLRYPHWFEVAESHVRPDVEAATAAPGERRGERGGNR